MSDRLAVSASWVPSSLKRELLFFDKIAIVDPHTMRGCLELFELSKDSQGNINSHNDVFEGLASECANMDFLIENGCLIDVAKLGFDFSNDGAFELIKGSDPELAEMYKGYVDAVQYKANTSHDMWVQSLQKYIKAREVFGDYLTVHIAELLRRKGTSAVSLSKYFSDEDFEGLELSETAQTSVSRVVLEKIPMPSDGVSFERILDFRRDEDARGYLAGLRFWMAKASRLETPSNELSEELDWLKYKHAERLTKHKIESQQSFVSGLFLNSFDIAEKILKVKWSEAAKVAISTVGRKPKPLIFDIDSEAGELNFLIQVENRFR